MGTCAIGTRTGWGTGETERDIVHLLALTPGLEQCLGIPNLEALWVRLKHFINWSVVTITIQLKDIFEFCSDKRLRSYSSNKLKINKVRTELFKGTFFNRLPYLWNNLPDKLRTSNLSLSLFKKQCNEFYKKKSVDPDHPHATWM